MYYRSYFHINVVYAIYHIRKLSFKVVLLLVTVPTFDHINIRCYHNPIYLV